MNLDQLRYFVAAARAGTFSRAAQQEGVTQPSLSIQMQKLEDSLGVSLFERHSRSVRLTPAGERLLPKAQSLLRQVVDAAQSITVEWKNRICGRLVAGAIPTVMPYWLAPRVASFMSRYPDINLQIVENTTARLVKGLRTGDLDIAIISLPVRASDVVCSELFREELLFVLPNTHPLAGLAHIEPRKLAGEHLLVLREGHCFREDALAACRRGLRERGTVFESDQFSSIFALVAGGFGITVAPRMAIPEAAGCRHIPIAGGPSRRIGYARIRRRHVPPAQMAFIAWLRELCRQSR